ncbi:Ras-related protein Rab-14 [Trichinella murrelli]|uniref:Ras-related protein Rab-14 n=1 Tax=Trichinella murrelli TaxID=144512 RepID=A0A0V0UBP8_9BILA|nr:Ras-related protein Rab-14 [Trichinella murrelli]
MQNDRGKQPPLNADHHHASSNLNKHKLLLSSFPKKPVAHYVHSQPFRRHHQSRSHIITSWITIMSNSDLYRLCYDTREKSVQQLHFYDDQKCEEALSIAVLGDYAVGKTALIHSLCKKQFLTKHQPTKSTKRSYISLSLSNGETVKLILNDTSGCKRLQGDYLYRCKGALIVYDITEPYSYANVRLHLNEIRRTMPPDTQITVVGTKADMVELRKVKFADAALFCSTNSLQLQECSARTGENVKNAFVELVERILERQRVDIYEPSFNVESIDQEINVFSKWSLLCLNSQNLDKMQAAY